MATPLPVTAATGFDTRGQIERRPVFLPALTSARFFAALWVVAYHYAQPLCYAHDAPLWLTDFFGRGAVAVGFFFILSGYILTHTYLGAADRLRRTALAFWQARLARIYPVYLLAIVCAAPTVLHVAGANGHTLSVGVLSVFMLQAWSPYWVLWWDGPSWSLSVEAFFYTIFPVLVVVVAALRTQSLLLMCVLCWMAIVCLPLWYLHYLPDGEVYHAHPLAAYWLSIITYHPLARLPEFVLGMALARLSTLHSVWTFPALGWVACITIILYATLAPAAPIAPVNSALLDPIFAVLIFALGQTRGLVQNLLSQRFLVYAGEASFALYILHVPLWDTLQWCSGLSAQQAEVSVPFFVAYVGIACLVSLAVYRWIEQPCRHLCRAAWRSDATQDPMTLGPPPHRA